MSSDDELQDYDFWGDVADKSFDRDRGEIPRQIAPPDGKLSGPHTFSKQPSHNVRKIASKLPSSGQLQ